MPKISDLWQCFNSNPDEGERVDHSVLKLAGEGGDRLMTINKNQTSHRSQGFFGTFCVSKDLAREMHVGRSRFGICSANLHALERYRLTRGSDIG